MRRKSKKEGIHTQTHTHTHTQTHTADSPGGFPGVSDSKQSALNAVCVSVAQSCLLCNPMDCNLPGASVQGILQARVLEWVAISFSRGSSWPRDQTHVSCIAGRFFISWPTREAPSIFRYYKNSVLLGRKLRHTDPPTQASVCQSKVECTPSCSPPPAEWAAGRQPFARGRVSGAHLVTCLGGGWPGSNAVDGGAGGGVWLEEQLPCVCVCVRACVCVCVCVYACVGGGQHWIGDPSWGPIITSMGDRQSPLLSRWGNWSRDSSNLWEGRGLPSAMAVHSPSPGRHHGPGAAVPCEQSLNETQEGQQLGHLAEQTPSTQDRSLIPGLGRSSREGNGYPLQYSYLENSTVREAWRAMYIELQRVGHSWTTKFIANSVCYIVKINTTL